MKKTLALLLALLIVLSFTSCDSLKNQVTNKLKEGLSVDTLVTGDEYPPYTVFEGTDVVVIDQKNITVKIGNIIKSHDNVQYTVTVNNSSKSSYDVSPRCVAVNGEGVGDYWVVYTNGEDEVTEDVTLYDLKDPSELTRLSMLLEVTDDDFNKDEYMIDIYPQGIDAYKKNTPSRDGEDVLVDKKDLFIATKGLSVDYFGDYQLNYMIINDSSQPLIICMTPVAINELSISGYDYHYILPDTYRHITAEFFDSKYLAQLGTEHITSITLDAQIKTLAGDELFKETLTSYLEGEKNATPFSYVSDEDDVIVAETDDFKLVYTLCSVDAYDDTNLVFIVENKTKETLLLSASDIKINDTAIDTGSFYCDLWEGRDGLFICDFSETDLTDNNINKIKSLEMTLEISDKYYNEVFDETVSFKLK